MFSPHDTVTPELKFPFLQSVMLKSKWWMGLSPSIQKIRVSVKIPLCGTFGCFSLFINPITRTIYNYNYIREEILHSDVDTLCFTITF